MDWVNVMEEFRDVVVRHTPQTPVQQPNNPNIQLMLLRSLVRTVSSQKKAKISTNLLAAAVHLAFLNSAVQKNLVLELPDDPLSLAQRLIVSHHIAENYADLECSIPTILTSENQLDDDDIKFLNDYTKSVGGPGLAGLRNPLHLALAISPLFLLLPQSLSKKHVNRKTLILVGVINTTFWTRCTIYLRLSGSQSRYLSRWEMGSHRSCWMWRNKCGACYSRW